MKLLLIENNPRIASRVKAQLNKNYTIDLAFTGEDGVYKAISISYGVIILDLGVTLQRGAKQDICAQIRSASVNTPILVLITPYEGIEPGIKLLNNGADDYLMKPFNTAELIARVNALARRGKMSYTAKIINLGGLEIDLQSRRVMCGDVPIRLRRKEFDVLEYLLTNRGRPLSRRMIMDHVWELDKESNHNTVDVHVKYLRDKIERPYGTSFIKTIYGIGYMIETAVKD